jgi:hypothetical protein
MSPYSRMTSPRLIPTRNLVLGDTGFAINDRPLQLSGTADRVDDALELYQYPVARPLDDAAGMLADLRVDELAAMRLEALVRSFLVRASDASSPPHRRRGSRQDGGSRPWLRQPTLLRAIVRT